MNERISLLTNWVFKVPVAFDEYFDVKLKNKHKNNWNGRKGIIKQTTGEEQMIYELTLKGSKADQTPFVHLDL